MQCVIYISKTYFPFYSEYVLILPKIKLLKYMRKYLIWKCCCSVAKSGLTICGLQRSKPPYPNHLPESAQIHVHWVMNDAMSDAIQPSHPLSPFSPSTFNFPQHHGLFLWVGSSHQVANLLELQLQCQFFQWLFSVDFL